MVIVDILRIVCSVIGGIVLLMWIAGIFGWADFALLFQVRP